MRPRSKEVAWTWTPLLAATVTALVEWGGREACFANGKDMQPRWRWGGAQRLQATPAVGPDATVYMVSGSGALYALSPDGVPKWRRQVAEPPLESPAAGPDGTVYVTSADGKLHAVASDGTPKWTCHVGAPGTNHVTVDERGAVYVASRDYHVYAVDPDGTVRWRFKTGAEVHSTPAIDPRGNVYFGSDDFFFYAVSPEGKRHWRYKTLGPIGMDPFVGPEGAILIQTDRNTLTVFTPRGGIQAQLTWPQATGDGVSRTDGGYYVASPGGLIAVSVEGSVLWKYPYADRALVVTPDGNVMPVEYTGWVRCLSPEEEVLWASNGLTRGYTSGSPALGPEGTVYIGGVDGVSANAPDGTLRWLYQADQDLTAAAFGADGSFYVGGYDGRLYALDAEGQTKWTCSVPGPLIERLATGEDGTVYGVTANGYVCAVSPAGAPKWQHHVGGNIADGPSIGPDQHAYVISGKQRLSCLTSQGELAWQVDVGGDIRRGGLSVGADGTVYVSLGEPYDVAAFTPAGEPKYRYRPGGPVDSAPVGDANGCAYLSHSEHYVDAIAPEGQLKWQADTEGRVTSRPALGSDGTVYVTTRWEGPSNERPVWGDRRRMARYCVCAFGRGGTLRWRLEGTEAVLGDPLLGPNDTLYILPEGDYQDHLWTVSASGELLWAQTPLPGTSSGRGGMRFVDPRQLAVAADGRAAVTDQASVSLIRPNGEIAWVVTGTWEAGPHGIPRWNPRPWEQPGHYYAAPRPHGSPGGW